MFPILYLTIFSVMNGKLNPPGNLNGEPKDHPWDYKNELLRLNNLTKSWDYTCSFCFKHFPSAQALGGHQNAHKSQRREERRLCVKDHISHRKRAFIESSRKSPDVAVSPNGKQAKLYHGGEGISSATACMATNGKAADSSLCARSFHRCSGPSASKPIFPVPIPKGGIKEEELDLTLKL